MPGDCGTGIHCTHWQVGDASGYDPCVFRLIGFFVLAWLLAGLLGQLPVVGPYIQRTGCLGIWVAAMLLSWGVGRWGNFAFQARRDASAVKQALAVDTPTGHGKVGSLFLAQGRARKALPHLENAAEGEPEIAEWHYRLGLARLALGLHAEAHSALQACLELDGEHGYGGARMRMAEVFAQGGHHESALKALEIYERNHGPGPESAYRRGLSLRKLGQKDEAKRAFEEVPKLAQELARYQKQASTQWVLKARLASLF